VWKGPSRSWIELGMFLLWTLCVLVFCYRKGRSVGFGALRLGPLCDVWTYF